MTQKDINKRNNAIVAFMGGPKYLRETLLPKTKMMDEEFHLMGPEDLKYKDDWNWLMPVWSKVRFQLTPSMVISAISYIDENNIEKLYVILSQVCIGWCINNNIKLE